jgi:hypothetical protein
MAAQAAPAAGPGVGRALPPAQAAPAAAGRRRGSARPDRAPERYVPAGTLETTRRLVVAPAEA